MKIGIIGVGSVGGAIASAIVQAGIASELVLFDTDAKRMRSAAMDLSHAAAFGLGTRVSSGTYRNFSDADIIIIAAGANQKIGQSRSDLVKQNAAVMRDVVPKITAAAKNDNLILIVVTNPLDSIVAMVRKISKMPAAHVIGTGTMLDSARLRAELAAAFGVSPTAIDARVLGEHGETAVINWTGANVNSLGGLTAKMKSEIEARIKGAAMEIIKGRGATWDGIAAATLDLVRCVANDERRIMPVSIADTTGIAYSMPRIVGRNGVVATLKPTMSAAESTALAASIKAIKRTSAVIG